MAHVYPGCRCHDVSPLPWAMSLLPFQGAAWPLRLCRPVWNVAALQDLQWMGKGW